MRRKVIKQGPTTLMISLPHAWAKSQRLGKGQEVEVEIKGDQLLVSPGPISTSREITVDVKHLAESSTRTVLVNAYRMGYDKITLRYDDPSALETIHSTLSGHLLGFEITKQGKRSAVIENLTEPSADRFEIIFKKILYNITLLSEETKRRIIEGDGAAHYEEIAHKIHQYDNFCRRVAIKTRRFGEHTPLFWSFSSILVHAQRELYHLNKQLDQRKRMRPHKLLDDLLVSIDLLKKGYLGEDLEALEKLHAKEKLFTYKHLPEALRVDPGYFHIGVAIKDLYLASSPLIGLILSRAHTHR